MMCQSAKRRNANDGAVDYNFYGSFVDKSDQVYTIKDDDDIFEKIS